MVWSHLFGRAPHTPYPPAEPTDRLVALDCALRLTDPATIAAGAGDAGRITDKARRLEEWLREARDERDAQARRLVLLLVCEHATPSTPLDRVRGLAKELHRYVTRR